MARPIALSKTQTWDYVLESNRMDPVEEQVVWKLRTLPYAVRVQLMSTISFKPGEGEGVIDLGKRYHTACQFGLAGAENYQDENGQPVLVSHKGTQHGVPVVSDEFLETMADDVLMELGRVVLERSTLSRGQVGKYEWQPT
jgi:hypothetical protein